MDNQLTPEQRKLVEDNFRLVYYLFGKLRYNEFKVSHGDDFISEGMIGLVKAAKTFDPTKCKFATYASRCINNEMFMFLRSLRKKDGRTSLMSQPIGGQSDDGVELTIGDTEVLEDTTMVDTHDRTIANSYNFGVCQKFLSKQNLKDQQIISLISNGKKQKQVAEEIGLSQSYVSRRFRDIKKRFAKYHARHELLGD